MFVFGFVVGMVVTVLTLIILEMLKNMEIKKASGCYSYEKTGKFIYLNIDNSIYVSQEGITWYSTGAERQNVEKCIWLTTVYNELRIKEEIEAGIHNA